MTQFYRTHDLNVASFLLVRGHRLVGVDGAAGGRREFRFDPAAESDVPAYFSGAVVPARALLGALKDLKVLIYSHA
jgi:hypothetical protein